MILQILKPQKNTDAHRPDPARLVPAIRMYQNADLPEATSSRAEPGHRGVPRQVARAGESAPGVRRSGPSPHRISQRSARVPESFKA